MSVTTTYKRGGVGEGSESGQLLDEPDVKLTNSLAVARELVNLTSGSCHGKSSSYPSHNDILPL